MIVNHFNTFPYGGAATAALRLHDEMLSQGVASRFWFDKDERGVNRQAVSQIKWRENRGDSNLLQRQWEKRRVRKICNLHDTHLAARDQSLELFSLPELTARTALETESFEQQIVHLHWLAFLADLPSFFRSIPESSPIVWTLHDMNPLTGGCHYSSGCEQFRSECGSCPQVVQPGSNDVSRHGFKIKQRAYRNRKLNIVTPSRWLMDLAKASPLFPTSTRFHHIRLGFDLNQLYPMSKQVIRDELGLEREKVVIGFGAESITNRRKGFDLLLKALARLPDKSNLQCAVFGSGEVPKVGFELPELREFGFVDNPNWMTKFYSACDVVVVPSREDNQPQVGLEAMACGTPVVGFDAGGIGEYVVSGETGRLAKREDASDLADQISCLVSDSNTRSTMATNCRAIMERDFDIAQQASKYCSLYEQLLSHEPQYATA